MFHSLNVGRKRKMGWIHGPGQSEMSVRQLPVRFEQESLERRLAILAIGAQISEIPDARPFLRIIDFRIHGAVQRNSPTRTVFLLKQLQCPTSGERKVDLETWNHCPVQKLFVART